MIISVFIVMHQEKRTHHMSDALRVAIFTPTTHPALEEVEQGFKETIQKLSSKPYVFTTFNANGNRSLLRAQAEEIVEWCI